MKKTSGVNPPVEGNPSKQRSAVTNRRRLFVEGPGNTAWARRFKDLMTAHSADLGGAEYLTISQLSLIRRSATLTVELEAMDGRLADGETVPRLVCAPLWPSQAHL